MERLNQLAVQLMNCRKRGNRLTLDCVLESARILSEARSLAGAGFGTWLAEQARMDRATAYRHLAVARFVREHVALTRQIATLSLAKIYALSSIDSAQAVRILTGQVKFSAPLEILGDVQFRREFRLLFPHPPRRLTRRHVYQATTSALDRAEKALRHASAFIGSMTMGQRQRIETRVRTLVKLISDWRGVA